MSTEAGKVFGVFKSVRVWIFSGGGVKVGNTRRCSRGLVQRVRGPSENINQGVTGRVGFDRWRKGPMDYLQRSYF